MRIPKGDDRFKTLRFLIRAIPKHDKRRALTFLRVKEGIGTATDGYRIHEAFLDMKEGFYSVKKNTKSVVELIKVDEEELKFPPTDDMWWDHSKSYVASEATLSEADPEGMAVTMSGDIARAMKQGGINPRFIDDLVGDKNEYWIAYVCEADTLFIGEKEIHMPFPVAFEYDKGTKWALIMPTRGN